MRTYKLELESRAEQFIVWVYTRNRRGGRKSQRDQEEGDPHSFCDLCETEQLQYPLDDKVSTLHYSPVPDIADFASDILDILEVTWFSNPIPCWL